MSYSGANSDIGHLANKQGHVNRWSPSKDAVHKKAKYRCYRCPHCGKQVESVRGRGPGAVKKLFYEANGETKHINEWAHSLNVTPEAIKYYLKKKKWTMQQAYDRLTDPTYTKPGPAQGHNWRKAVKMEERK